MKFWGGGGDPRSPLPLYETLVQDPENPLPQQNVKNQSIYRALHSKSWSFKELSKFITDLNSMNLKNASLKQFDTNVKYTTC